MTQYEQAGLSWDSVQAETARLKRQILSRFNRYSYEIDRISKSGISKQISGPKKNCVQKFLGPSIFWVKKMLGLNKFLVQKIFGNDFGYNLVRIFYTK